ncbi:MAG: pilus assembly protein [Proteobacteria bacterium]|nr:pilus assembly protein [Pseudomonadota bacterium]
MYRSLYPNRISRLRRQVLVALAGFACTVPAWAGVSIPNVPLQAGTTIPANVVVTFDDTGSMHWRFIYIHNPDGSLPTISGVGINSAATGNEASADNFSNCDNCVVTGDTTANGGNNNDKYMVDKSYTTNGLYYNPAIDYSARWRYPDGSALSASDTTNYQAACNDHNYANYHYSGGGLAININCSTTVDLSQYVNTFYVPINAAGNLSDPTNYYRYQIRGNDTSGTVTRSQLMKGVAAGAAGSGCEFNTYATYNWRGCTQITPTGRTASAEIQNFANWYTYYNTRIKTAKAGLSSAFSGLTNVRAGFLPLNFSGNNTSNVYIPVGTDNGLFEDLAGPPAVTNKSNWYKVVMGTAASGGTGLRVALDKTGQYFANQTGGYQNGNGPYGPLNPDGTMLSCRQNFNITTTDGYWNETYNGWPEADANAGYPFADQNGGMTTLADVAWHYWATDLMPALANNVPTSAADPANWQHMTTFTISVGAKGTIDPATILADIASNIPFTWPKPVSNQVTTIDDLFHASVNGHGKFVVASNPVGFVNALKDALDTIAERTSASSNVSVNSTQLSTSTNLFQAIFVAGKWTGNLIAYPINTSGVVSNTPAWQASQQLLSFANRKAHAYTWAAGAGTTFPTAGQVSTLGGGNAAQGTLVANYILGDQSQEILQGGTFRNRTSVLGDFVDSSPAYVAGNGTTIPDMVYAGSNDGMMHAFNAGTGAEMFDYVPSGINFTNLATLTDPHYQHSYFVDGSIVVSTKAQTKNTADPTGKNILVGVLGRGGNTVYALDVSDPANFDQSKVLWEYTAPGLGNSLGTPVITRLNQTDVNGDFVTGVVIGNGPNSANGHSEVFVLNIRTGALIRELDTGVGNTGLNPNGMSTPKGWDADRNGTIDTLYAGDLLGNVWEIDVSDSNPANWISVFTSGATWQPLYTAKDSTGKPQPITSGFTIGLNPSDFSRWIFFGTGRYLTSTDPADQSVQTWYGIQDSSSPITSVVARNDTILKQRKIVAYGTVNGKTIRAFESGTSGDMAGKQGWYVDLLNYVPTPAVPQGERIVSDSVLLGNILLSASIIPSSNDPCSAGGTGFVNAISPFTGTALSNPFFDVNGDGVVNGGDKITSGGNAFVPGSVDLGVGMPSLPSFVQKVITGTGSAGNIGQIIVTTPTNSGRISWREVLIGN